MNDKLIEAFFEAPHTVLGRRLKPLTLRHAFVLAAADNELLTGGEGCTVDDIYQAVEICSRDGLYFFGDNTPSEIRKTWWHWRTRKYDMVDEFIKLGRYFEDYTPRPEVWTSGSGKKGAGCHWIISTIAGLMKHLGMSKDDAWNESPGSANWLLVAALEADPMISIDVMSEEEARAVELLKSLPDEPLTRAQVDSHGDTD